MGVPGQIDFIVDSISKQKTQLHVIHVLAQVHMHMSICIHLYRHIYDRLPSSSSAMKVRRHHVHLPSLASLLLPVALAAASHHLRAWLILCCPCRWLCVEILLGLKAVSFLCLPPPVFPFSYHTCAVCRLVLFSIPCSLSHRHCLPHHFALPF